MKKFDVTVYQVPLKDGLTKKQIQTILNMLPEFKSMIPLITSENNTTAIGFILGIQKMTTFNVYMKGVAL